eukprot:CAMPEP_0113589388 /NCGR_PEP_ID=MMETSP0015_2-20120614/36059_1 /TAXON_ID=2838 /ORGANISM="Odontella" /LENGTH=525 /DNA_ID=CAMNT_0000495399 /DNA_START=225 /DNA_END=1802 /DNA_ORIENTATION=+ /assembly_acc=CAM_ASM_000160
MAHRGGHDGTSPVYQIDFTALATGKRIASTKRRVRWRFGFTNQQALQNGETGTACRGEEHDVTLVWSITSGKRLVLADGQEVHYSVSRANDFDCSWTMRGGHVLKLIAHASPPINATPGFRQYDFLIDGQSFFSMPKVYRLGLTSGRGGGGRQAHHAGGGERPASDNNIAALEAPHNHEEEEAYLQEAIKQSLDKKTEETKPALPPSEPPKKEEDNLLLDFFDAPPPATAAPPPAPLALPAPVPVQENGFGSSNPQPNLSDVSSDFAFGVPAPAPAVPALGAGFAQPPPPPAPLAPPAPTLGSSFTQPPAPGIPGFATPSQPNPPPQPPASNLGFASPPPAPHPAPATGTGSAPGGSFVLSMNPPAPAPSATNADQAYQNIANMTDFNLGSKPGASNPFGNTAVAQPTLGQMKNMTGSGNQALKQGVMNAPPPGAMVVSNNQAGNWGSYSQTTGQQMNQVPGQGYGQTQPPPPPPPGGQFGGYGAGAAQTGGYGTQQQYGQQQYGQQQTYGQPQQSQQYQYQQQY